MKANNNMCSTTVHLTFIFRTHIFGNISENTWSIFKFYASCCSISSFIIESRKARKWTEKQNCFLLYDYKNLASGRHVCYHGRYCFKEKCLFFYQIFFIFRKLLGLWKCYWYDVQIMKFGWKFSKLLSKICARNNWDSL